MSGLPFPSKIKIAISSSEFSGNVFFSHVTTSKKRLFPYADYVHVLIIFLHNWDYSESLNSLDLFLLPI